MCILYFYRNIREYDNGHSYCNSITININLICFQWDSSQWLQMCLYNVSTQPKHISSKIWKNTNSAKIPFKSPSSSADMNKAVIIPELERWICVKVITFCRVQMELKQSLVVCVGLPSVWDAAEWFCLRPQCGPCH